MYTSPQAGVDGMNAQAQTHVMKWFLRALPFVMWPFISNFPTVSIYFSKRIQHWTRHKTPLVKFKEASSC